MEREQQGIKTVRAGCPHDSQQDAGATIGSAALQAGGRRYEYDK